MRYESLKALGWWVPAHDQSCTKRLTLEAPFRFKFGALSLRKWRDDGLTVALLAGCEPLAVCPLGVNHPGMQARFAPHNTEAAMAVDV